MRQFLALLKEWAYKIAQWFRVLPLWLKYALVALLFAALAASCVWRWGLRQQIDAGLIAKDTNVQSYVNNLWFLPDGTLVGTEGDSYPKVVVSIWHPQNQSLVSERKTFNLNSFENYIQRKAAEDDKYSGTKNSAARETLFAAFAITRDGSRMAVLAMGYLAVFPHDWTGSQAEITDEVDLGTKETDSPCALTVTDTGLIALAYPNGKVEFRDFNHPWQVVGGRETKLVRPSIMKPLGNFLAVVSAENAAVVMLDLSTLTRDTPFHGYPLSSLEKFTLAISNSGRLAIGTGSPRVFLTQPDGGGDASIPLEAYGTVKILSFYDQDRVLAGGDFRDVYLLAQGQLPYNIAVAPKGVNALAVNGDRIAFAGTDGVSLLWHTKRRLLNAVGKIAIGVFGALLVGLVGVYRYDLRKRRESHPLPPEKPPEIGELRLPEEPPADLVEVCAAGECVLYGGAGLSARSGLPIWKEFVHGLLDWAVENRFLEESEATSFHAEIETGDADPVADSVISRLKSAEQLSLLNNYLRQVFLKSSSPSAFHFLLKRIKFSAVLTTNFDNLLERNYQVSSDQIYTPKDAEKLLTALTKRDYFILKLYGTLEQPETVIVTPAQYESGIAGNKIFSQFMQTLFVSRTLLFIGASLEGIEAYLRGISLPKDVARMHYALVAVTGNAWRAKADLLERRYGIKVFPYTPGDDHAELGKFLKRLASKVAAEPTAATGTRQVTSRLKRLSLENIGPFENLDLEFHPDMQILLGDNGVGKSTILKAMALALCGEEAREYAGRVLRFGCAHGKIVLETDNKTSYVTEIDRNESDGETEITSNTARPLEAEGWLAIGFPPLRTTSWVPPKGPDADFKFKSRPVADDLLPIVTGDVDPRLDKLKQWIVNLDYLSIKSGSDGKGRTDRYRRLVEKVFTVIATVTEKMTLKYVGVESGTNRIIIKTDDGNNIPLEALSQGTISLIGWIGILMQRLYEVYDRDEDPTKRYALILMDEIDAHMHPLWQRTLVNHLKEIFPKAQFIATTHSPLVVGGLPVKQVIRFARNKQGKVIMPPIEQDMTWGYTDQILTSMLFGLPTSLDDTTERKQKRYYELFEMEDRGGHVEEYEQLKQELMARVPPPSGTYEEKHEEQLSEAKMLKKLGEKLRRRSPDGGQVLLNRAETLRANLEGSKKDDSN